MDDGPIWTAEVPACSCVLTFGSMMTGAEPLSDPLTDMDTYIAWQVHRKYGAKNKHKQAEGDCRTSFLKLRNGDGFGQAAELAQAI